MKNLPFLIISILLILSFSNCQSDDMDAIDSVDMMDSIDEDPVVVKDTIPPISGCIETLVTGELGNAGSVTFWATDFNVDSQDNVTLPENLQFSFSGDSIVPSLQITCDDIVNGVSEFFMLEIWAWDEEENRDFCYATLQVFDYLRPCDGSIDDVPPTPNCYQNLSTAVFTHSGSIEIWASDFDQGSTDNITVGDNLSFSFSGDSIVHMIEITCEDIPNNTSETFTYEIWVWDEADNRDFCLAVLLVDDNIDACCVDCGGTPPIAICLPQLEIRLDSTGIAEIHAKELDDGSYHPIDTSWTKHLGYSVFRNNSPKCDQDTFRNGNKIVFCDQDIKNENLEVSLIVNSGWNTAICTSKVKVLPN